MELNNEIDTKKILANLNIDSLNEMQLAALKANSENDNVLLLSKTGSGKTLGFLFPLLYHLNSNIKNVQALIIVPSRELAIQIDDVLRKMQTGFKTTLCYGGHKREIEETNLIQAPTIIIGTPGRLADHLRRGNFSTEFISTLILDEFDKSLEIGFLDEIKFIVDELKNVKKRILTSATESVDIPAFMGLSEYQRLDFLDMQIEDAIGMEIKTVFSDEKDKGNTIIKLICFLGNRSTIVFCNHRESVKRVNDILVDKGIVSVFYHGGMEQQERDAALCKFRNGTSNILITTDLASRGLDIPNIRNIVHYHLPMNEDIFTHRNGRTARMQASGTAYVIFSDDEKLPNYITNNATSLTLENNYDIPEKPKWSTLFIAAGKKDKVNKIDIVGFFSQKGKLKQEDIGLIEVKDFFSFVAIKKIKVSEVLQLINTEKIKNKKVKIDIAK